MKVATTLLAACLIVLAVDAVDDCEICRGLAWALRFAAHQKTLPEEVMKYTCGHYKHGVPNGTDEDVAKCEKVMKEILETEDMVKHARNLENSTVYEDEETICTKDKDYCKT
ncbi:hypothetical protein Y032_0005g2710 [Ancylostoma ceylanicum]|uniref:Saposin B-type domain-containing protein n=1 Tax=Ancylostoma ceylanicum TaxID=53326 RepID=A0A016VU71_9BILA|nr:hypothetical protein Y032_0005g2710 [Ancylostoma ceylanicum]